ncbi:hypothetical protein PG989_012749 [Apiospora arundinis]
MQFLSVSILALAGAAFAQNYRDTGLVCTNLWGDRNPNQLDPKGWYVTDPKLCAAIGGKLVENNIICCPTEISKDGFREYNDACNFAGGSTNHGTQFDIVPAGWTCPQ